MDRDYSGKAFILAILHTFYWCLQVVVPPVWQKGFVVQQKRWVVERTFAWFSRFRRLTRENDCEQRFFALQLAFRTKNKS